MLGWELPPHNSGGLGIACYQLCKALSKNDIDLEFIVPYQAEHKIDFMRVTPATAEGLFSAALIANPYDSAEYQMSTGSGEWLDMHQQQHLYETAVARLADEKEFDIVHAHDWLTFRAALRVKERRNCPIVLHVHSVESDRAGSRHGNPLVHEIEATSLLLADRVIAVSEHTKRSIIRDYGIPADKIEVVHNSIEAADITPLDDDNAYRYLELMKELGYKIVVNIGRLTIQKGLPNFLRAAQLVVQQSPKTLFLIVGSGEQYYELIDLAAELEIGQNVLFTDFQRGKQWRDAFGIGDLFVMPSVSEPFGLTPLEAIGYGTPALISKQSGVSEVLQSCLKVDHWDVREMANQMHAVLTSPELHETLRVNGAREYARLSWDSASDKIMKIYDQHLTGAAA